MELGLEMKTAIHTLEDILLLCFQLLSFKHGLHPVFYGPVMYLIVNILNNS